MSEKEINICRPDSFHYCVDCCAGRNCNTLLGKLPDGTLGCLGHPKLKNTSSKIKQTPFCAKMTCLTEEQLKHTNEILSIINSLPLGRFSMQKVLIKANLFKK